MICFISIHDETGRFLFCSKGAEIITEYTTEELLRFHDVYLLFHEKDRERIYRESHILTKYNLQKVTYRIVSKSGNLFWARAYSVMHDNKIYVFTLKIPKLFSWWYNIKYKK